MSRKNDNFSDSMSHSSETPPPHRFGNHEIFMKPKNKPKRSYQNTITKNQFVEIYFHLTVRQASSLSYNYDKRQYNTSVFAFLRVRIAKTFSTIFKSSTSMLNFIALSARRDFS